PLDQHGVGAGRHVLQPLEDHRLGENGGGGGAVTGDVVGLGGDFLEELGAHVLVGIGQLDLLGDRDAVLGDDGGAVLPLQDDVAALGTERHLDGVGDSVDTPFKGAPRFAV